MTIKLPPLPEMVQIDRHIPTNYVIRGYTAEQMEAYAREAVRLNMAPLSDEQIKRIMLDNGFTVKDGLGRVNTNCDGSHRM